jgi:hypothetical protein
MRLRDIKERIIVSYYEITNWLFIKRTIRKHKYTADWENFNLRADWVGRIYTVINPQSPGDDGDAMDVLRIKYTERFTYMFAGLSLTYTFVSRKCPVVGN